MVTASYRSLRNRAGATGATGTISITIRVRRANWNAMKPRIQCVLAQWNPGFSAFGSGAGWCRNHRIYCMQ